VNRTEFQQLDEVRVKEAEALLAAGLWDGAYYLAGYAVECGLKACIAKLTKAEDFPDKDRVVKSWSHRYEELILVAGLKSAFDVELKADPDFEKKWTAVKDWAESARYARWTEDQARALYAAVTDPAHGVLRWISRFW
jgi:HEPN domain-containing protein